MATRFGISLIAVTIALAVVPVATAGSDLSRTAQQAEVIAGLLLQLESNLTAVDATIARHDMRIEELYDLRDAAEDDPDTITLYDGMIDQLTLVLDETERLRADLAANIASVRGSLSALEQRQNSGESQ